MSNIIVIEGVDGVGKSTVATELAKALHAAKVIRMFSRSTMVERLVHDHPTSIGYYILIIIKTWVAVFRAAVSGYDVIFDRYVQTVDTFSPDNSYLHNKVGRRLLSFLFVKTDFYIELIARPEKIQERLTRLAEFDPEKNCEYHQKLMKNQEVTEARQEEYREVYARVAGSKTRVDTSEHTSQEVAREIMVFITHYKKYAGKNLRTK